MRVLPLALLLAGCIPATEPPVPVTAPPPPAAPVVTARPLPADWRDWPLTPGVWRYQPDPVAPVASFDRLQLRCDRAGRRVALLAAGPAPVTVRTTSLTRTLAVPDLAAADPLLDAMAFSRGHFVVEQPGQAPLVIPAHAEVGRVIEDCRG